MDQELAVEELHAEEHLPDDLRSELFADALRRGFLAATEQLPEVSAVAVVHDCEDEARGLEVADESDDVVVAQSLQEVDFVAHDSVRGRRLPVAFRVDLHCVVHVVDVAEGLEDPAVRASAQEGLEAEVAEDLCRIGVSAESVEEVHR